MDPSACRVIYIDGRFNTERWISRDGLGSTNDPRRRKPSSPDFDELPPDLQANVNAFLSVFNQVFVCRSGRAFSAKLAEIHGNVRADCTPILACFDVGSERKNDILSTSRPRFNPEADTELPSRHMLKRELTFSAEADESYGLQLLSRIASDLQVEEDVKLIIPVAIVQPQRKESYDLGGFPRHEVTRAPYGTETEPKPVTDESDSIDPQLMLQCLDAGALDVVKSPLDKAGIMGLTVHAYRIYKSAKADESHYMSRARGRGRKASWVGIEEEKPYAYLREAMVKKLLKGICDPQEFIEDYQHRDLFIDPGRKNHVAEAVGKWSFSGQDFNEDELVYAGYYILNHALSVPDLQKWRMSEDELLRFMQGCRIAYNSFVLYHNFKHAVDVLQSTFYFLLQIGILPPYPKDSTPPPHANNKSPVAKLVGPFEALTLLISAIGHDVGHPGVNNMFLVKLNAPLAQLYNDTSVLEAFHCAAYSQILRRHWPTVFHDKAIRKLMISSILATDMGCHSDYMQQLGNLQEKIHESKVTDGWTPKDIETYRVLTCGLLIKCADISNVARPWAVAEKWTYKLQDEFAHQGEMERNIGMETTLFGGPPELGNMLKLANGQIGFMTIFAHPLFANVSDIIPAMGFAAEEILLNKGVWFTRAEHEKQIRTLNKRSDHGGGVSPRSQSPVDGHRKPLNPGSPLRSTMLTDKAFADHKQNGDHGSALKQVEGLSASESRPINGGETASEPSSINSHSKALPNGVSTSPNTTPRQLPVDAASNSKDSVSHVELNNTDRDAGVSMRAGSEALPAKVMEQAESDMSKGDAHNAFAAFKFATSNIDEPVRTFDPAQGYPAVQSNARASAPVNDAEHLRIKDNMSGVEDKGKPSEPTIPESTGKHEAGDVTPTRSNEAQSYTTGKTSEDALSPPKSTHSAARDRAISTPMPPLGHSYSMTSEESAKSQRSNKQDFKTSIFSNGDGTAEERRNRKMSTRTLGRKRSKLKMNLQFWKRRSSDNKLPEEVKRDVST